MSLKKKEKTKIGFSSILRLIIFLFIVFVLINFLANKTINSQPQSNFSQVLGESFGSDILDNFYSKLPESSRSQIENINQTEISKFLATLSKIFKPN